MKSARLLIAALWLTVSGSTLVCAQDPAHETPQVVATAPAGPFLVKPYLQLGHSPAAGSLILVWHAADADAGWTAEYRSDVDHDWRKAQLAQARRIAVPGVDPHWVMHAVLAGLDRTGTLSYRVRKGDEIVFSAEARGPKGVDEAYRFVAFGDGGAGTPEQKAIAFRAFEEKPDFVMIPGDIVYARGRVTEYRDKFWPVYNADEASPSVGVAVAPLDPVPRRARQPRHRDSRH